MAPPTDPIGFELTGSSSSHSDGSPIDSRLATVLEAYELDKDRKRLAGLDLQALRDEIIAAFPDLAELFRAYFASEDVLAGQLPIDDGRQYAPQHPQFVDIRPFSHYGPVEGVLGWGGLGSVFKVKDRVLGRHVALKIPLANFAHDVELRGRLKREARIGGRLQHPGIVPVYELGDYQDGDPIPYFTMKLIEGEELAHTLQRRQSPAEDLPRFVQWFAQVCHAVAYAHAHGIVHRDIKPRNILVGNLGEVQVTDWGLAKDLMDLTADSAYSIFRSEDGVQGLGTPAYAAREQLQDAASVGPQADVFSLGAVLTEILTGTAAYTSDSPDRHQRKADIERKASDGDLTDAWQRLDASGAPARLVALAKECLTADPASRPADAGIVSAQVDSYLEGLQQAQLEDQRRIAEQAKALAEVEAAARKSAEQREHAERSAKYTVSLMSAMIVLLVGIVGILLWHRSLYERQLRVAEATKKTDQLLLTLNGQIEKAHQLNERTRTPQDVMAVREAWKDCLPVAQKAETIQAIGDITDDARLQSVQDKLKTIHDEIARWEQLNIFLAALQDAATLCGERQFEFRADYERSARAFTAAFEAFGIDLVDGPPADIAERLRGRIPRNLQEHVATAVDLWAITESTGTVSQRISQIADQFSPARDQWRPRLRIAAQSRDVEALGRLATEARGDRTNVSRCLLTGVALRECGLALSSPQSLSLAINVLKDAQLMSPGDYFLNIEAGNTLAKLTEPRLTEAAQYYRAALAANPRSPTAYGNLGLVLMLLGALDEATNCFEMAKDLQPDNLTALFGVALLELAMHLRAAEAERASNEILARRRNDPNALALRGLARFLQGKLSRSKADIDLAFAQDDDSYMPTLAKAISLSYEGDYDHAADVCQAFYDSHPQAQGSALLLAASRFLDGSSTETERLCREQLQRPHEGSNRDLFGMLLTGALLLQGKCDEALNECRRLRVESPSTLPPRELLVLCLFKHGYYSAAKAESDDLTQLTKDGSVQKFLAQWRSFWLTPFADLLNLEGRVKDLDPDHPKGSGLDLVLAETALAQGRFRVARTLYEGVLRTNSRLGDGMSMLGRFERISHRLNAAQAAVMDCTGAEETTNSLTPKQQSELRTWARKLAESEVDAILTSDDRNKRKHAVRRQLTFLLATPSFASVRNENDLRSLGGDDQREWRQLWARVRTALDSL